MFFTNLFESNLRVRDFDKQIINYTSTQSTNDDIWRLFNDNNKENILVVTDNQLNGRGRLNNRWFSKPGHSITCSFLLNDVFDRNHFSLHSILIPVAIINGVKNFLSINLETKWPNDIMYHNKKIGGILLESKYNKKALILNVGIGLNVKEDKIFRWTKSILFVHFDTHPYELIVQMQDKHPFINTISFLYKNAR